tara:strand:+ start:6810 stop:8096 length:1287 start_codon:yes stop_codon:yes gene_type:complete
MKEINNFVIDSSSLTSAGGSRQYTVFGSPDAVFSIIAINEAGQLYNFPEKTIVSEDNDTIRPKGNFTSTPVSLFKQKLDKQGEYTSVIQFPPATDGKYTVVLQAEPGFDTSLSKSLSKNNVYHAAEIYQYQDTVLTFAVQSDGSSGTYTSNPPATQEQTTGFSTSVTSLKFNRKVNISWSVALGSSQFVIARQPEINDFFFTTTKLTSNDSSGREIQMADISGLSVGMAVSGSGIAAGSIIKKIIPGYKDENKSTATDHVYSIPKALNSENNAMIDSPGGTIFMNNSSTWGAGATLTFKGFGSAHAEASNNTKFSVSNLAVTIDPVVTTTDSAVSSSTTIPITSTNGIKAAEGVIMSGIGITGTPHVDAVSAGVNVTASSAQTIENGQTVTFTGSSRNATVTADIVVEKFGKDNLTIYLELDNILTVG